MRSKDIRLISKQKTCVQKFKFHTDCIFGETHRAHSINMTIALVQTPAA